MKDYEKRRKAKDILSGLFCNSFTWKEDENITDGMTEDEIEAVGEILDSYIATICKRYKI